MKQLAYASQKSEVAQCIRDDTRFFHELWRIILCGFTVSGKSPPWARRGLSLSVGQARKCWSAGKHRRCPPVHALLSRKKVTQKPLELQEKQQERNPPGLAKI